MQISLGSGLQISSNRLLYTLDVVQLSTFTPFPYPAWYDVYEVKQLVCREDELLENYHFFNELS